jgi:hypothetical protein
MKSLTVLGQAAAGTLWLIVALIGFGIVWAVVRLVFVLDADVGMTTSTRDGRSLIIAYGPVAKTADDTIDLSRIRVREIAAIRERPKVRAGTVIVLDHLEAVLADTRSNEATVKVIRGLMQDDKKEVVLRSAVDPLPYLTREKDVPSAEVDDASTSSDRLVLQQWADLLAGFVRHEVLEDPPSAAAGETDQDHACAARNLRLWRYASRAEKLALRQLAEEGFITPGDVSLVRGLLRARVVRRTPTFELLDPSFERFVLGVVGSREVAMWEREAGPSAWSRLRTPLGALALLVGGLVFYLRPEAFNSMWGVVTGVSAGLPILMKMFGLLGNEGRGAKAG